jgi:hypothetical protein
MHARPPQFKELCLSSHRTIFPYIQCVCLFSKRPQSPLRNGKALGLPLSLQLLQPPLLPCHYHYPGGRPLLRRGKGKKGLENASKATTMTGKIQSIEVNMT